MKNKRKLLILFSIAALVSCKKEEEQPKLGEIQTPTGIEGEEKMNVKEEFSLEDITVNSSMENKEKTFFNIGAYNDGGVIKMEDYMMGDNENITEFIASGESLLYKDTDNNIFYEDALKGEHRIISEKDIDYSPFKFGTEGVFILSVNGDKSHYKVVTPSGAYEVNKEKDMILADDTYAYMFKDGKFYRVTLATGEEKEIKVKVDGKEETIKNMYDRFDNKNLVFHIGSTAYLLRTVDVNEDGINLSKDKTVKANDIEKILRDNKRNDNGCFVYEATDGKLKVYDKYANAVTVTLPNVLKDKEIPVLDTSVVFGEEGEDEYAIYFTDYHRTYRYMAKSKELVEVKQEPMSRLEEYAENLALLHEGHIVFHLVKGEV